MNITANTDYNCPFCEQAPHIMVRDDGKCGIFCGNEDCDVTVEIKAWFDIAQHAEEAWDCAIGFYDNI